MLTHLHIRDFAIVDRLELELAPGMTVLTGETGAGKSILIDALGLALGERADSTVVAPAAERSEVSAGFDLRAVPAALRWLEERELEDGEECVLRRTVGRDGRSKGYINGRPAPIAALRELGDLLVDIHGQHEHQSLLRPEVQTQLLDGYGGHTDLARRVAELARQWRTLREEWEQLATAGAERESRRELLSYQIDELEQLDLQSGELESLAEEQRRLANGGRLLESGQLALGMLYEDDEASAGGLLGGALRQLEELQGLDSALAPVTELLAGAEAQLKEGALELRRYLEALDLDPERLEWVEQRLEAIHDLARKHRQQPEDLTDLQTRLAAELAELQGSDSRAEALREEVARLSADYLNQATELSARRTSAAARLGEEVSERIRQLSMPNGRFEVVLESREAEGHPPGGLERVNFLVSANPGQPPRPLAKVASGGELSRISLALQVATIQAGTVPTLIFDEVDVGIGGGVAEIVGRELRHLGGARQVLTVTHLPQVAAQGHHHLQVSKPADGARPRVQPLAETERVQEIGRMLGGVEITRQTLAHAEEMLARAGVTG